MTFDLLEIATLAIAYAVPVGAFLLRAAAMRRI